MRWIVLNGKEEFMIGKEKIDRINELAKKNKEQGLTEEEKKEREILRKEYIEKFRENFRGQLNQIRFVEDMSEEELAEYNRKHKKNS